MGIKIIKKKTFQSIFIEKHADINGNRAAEKGCQDKPSVGRFVRVFLVVIVFQSLYEQKGIKIDCENIRDKKEIQDQHTFSMFRFCKK